MANPTGKRSPQYPLELRMKVLEALEGGMRVCEAIEQFGVPRRTINEWKARGKDFRLVTDYSPEVKKEVCEALDNGVTVKEASELFGINRSTIFNWERKLRTKRAVKALPPSPLGDLETLRGLLTQVPYPNRIEAENLANRWGVGVAINYCRVILAPTYRSRQKLRYTPLPEERLW